LEATDGWIAVNLAREEDRDLLPAWLSLDVGQSDWPSIEACVRDRPRDLLISSAALLGLPVAAVGETICRRLAAPLLRRSSGTQVPLSRPIRVVDLSALWAGPLCGAILAAMGAEVIKIESLRRPDPTRVSTPDFFKRLSGGKSELQLDFADPDHLATLWDIVRGADVLITSARPRALAGLGLKPDQIFEANPNAICVTINGYGFEGPDSVRVAFGDDAAAAGGLVRWTAEGEPRFLGDALADPVTGLVAAAGALNSLAMGGGMLVDAALARCAAGAAAALHLERAA
jgi:crotonobetainyl-CoA:carnitine CoA-transferase CaiB-like acyl-CoA transferase